MVQIIRFLISKKFGIYIIGGLLSAGVDILAIYLIMSVSSNIFLSTTGGFFLGLIFNYFYHFTFTFKSHTSLIIFIRYLAVVLLNYFITLAFVYTSYSIFEIGLTAGKILSLPVIAIIGFFLGGRWIFK
jgi:putative flippase GtrA